MDDRTVSSTKPSKNDKEQEQEPRDNNRQGSKKCTKVLVPERRQINNSIKNKKKKDKETNERNETNDDNDDDDEYDNDNDNNNTTSTLENIFYCNW